MKNNHQTLSIVPAVIVLIVLIFCNVSTVKATEAVVSQENMIKFAQLMLYRTFNDNILQSWGSRQVGEEMGQTTYRILSSSPSHPHFVRLDKDGQVNFVKITIDHKKQDTSTSMLKTLGEPEIIVGQSRAEMLYGFPSQGYGFVMNEYSGSITSLLKFTPKTMDSFIQDEAKRYQIDIESKLLPSNPQINMVETIKTGFDYWIRIFRTLVANLGK